MTIIPKSDLLSNRFFILITLCLLTITTFSSKIRGQTPRECLEGGNEAMAQGDFNQAIHFYDLLNEYMVEANDNPKEAIKKMIIVYQRLGVCYLLTGQFEKCIDVFKNRCFKFFPKQASAPKEMLFMGDSFRFMEKYEEALKIYKQALKDHESEYNKDQKLDLWTSIAKSHLAKDESEQAMQWFKKVSDNNTPGTSLLHSWAIRRYAVAALQEMRLDDIYPILPELEKNKYFTSEDALFNIAVLKAADKLYSKKNFKDALRLYQLVSSRELIEKNIKRKLQELNKKSQNLRKKKQNVLRELLRTHEWIGEFKNSLKLLQMTPAYEAKLKNRISQCQLKIGKQ